MKKLILRIVPEKLSCEDVQDQPYAPAAPTTLAAPTPAGLKPWLLGMNQEQASVIAHTHGPIFVAAVAGAGKTRALVNRIARMVHDGIDPESILAVTFGKEAAREMNDRLEGLGITSARVGTWHSLCIQILREDKTQWGEWKIDDKDRHQYAVKDAVGFKHLNWKKADVKALKSFIGLCKANLFEPDSDGALKLAQDRFGSEALLAVQTFAISQELIEEQGLLTFDDYLVFAHRHLSSDEDVRRAWAGRWEFFLADEQQDSNPAQKEIANLLCRDHRNYMVVGDPAQSIYQFRGTNPDYFMAFPQEWNATTVYMNRNYRSGSAIIEVANRAIAPAKVKLPVDMIAERGFKGKVDAVECEDFDDEGKEFVAWVKQAHEADDVPWSSFTCLFRTHAQSRAAEEALLKDKIPYVIVGATSFYERKEVKDLLGYLRVAVDRDASGDAVRRCINAPFRFLGARFVERVMAHASGSPGRQDLKAKLAAKKAPPVTISVEEWAQIVNRAAQESGTQRRQVVSAEEWVSIIRDLRNDMNEVNSEGRPVNKPSTLLLDLVRRVKYVDWLVKENGEESIESSPGANVRELIRVAERFGTVDELLNYIEESIAASEKQKSSPAGERVLLMSIHKSKGSEWPRVWILGCNEMILPHARGDIEEERRLFYVAVTRAKDELVCSYVRKLTTSSGIRDVNPSVFLADAGLTRDGNL